MNTIVIIGTGWYGLHIFLFLKQRYKNIKIVILEKNNDIFNNSSNYNQNRLHLGYHYPRSYDTRELCKYNYSKFIDKYRDLIDFIDNNFYCISNESIIDYKSYLQIFANDVMYDHTIIENSFISNIEGKFINTKEKIINSKKVKHYFNKKLSKQNIKFNYNVDSITRKKDKIIINNDIECDYLIDCTYNKLGLQTNYMYELTISLLYKRKNFDKQFDSLTVMDGPFFSLFPRDITKKMYTLTHVKHTPLVKSDNIDNILNFSLTQDKIMEVKKLMEEDVKKYYISFLKDFEYNDYFTSYKCKSISGNDTRNCNIIEDNNIISVNCGKITGIFQFEQYVKDFFDAILYE